MNSQEEITTTLSDKPIFEIKQAVTNSVGRQFDLVYREDDPTKDMKDKIWGSIRAVCFCNDKLVIVYSRNHWALPGGRIELGETIDETTAREVKEETNMEVIGQKLIGYQDIYGKGQPTERHPFVFCTVKPFGDFKADLDESVTEIKLIDPKDYKQHFDYGPIGDRVVARALEIKGSQL